MSAVKLFLHNKTLLPGFLEVDLDKITPSELITSVIKQAKLTSTPETYKFFVTSYLKDVKPLDSDVKDIKALELTSLSTIFIISSDGPKPKRRIKKSKEPEIEISGDDEIEMDIDDVVRTLEKTSDKKKRAAIIKFGAANGEKLLESKGFLDCSKETLIALLKEDSFAAEEGPIFEGILKWAKKKAKKDDEVKKMISGDVFKLIRFPLLNTTDIATKVVPIGILEMQQTLDLFSYTGALQALRDKDKDVKAPPLPKSLADMNNKPRVPVRKPSTWGLVSQSTPRITISPDKKTATHDSSSGHNWVLSEDSVSKGKKEWKIRIDHLQSNNWIMIGVANQTPNSVNSYNSPGTWALASSAQVYKNGATSSNSNYTKYYVQGGTVSCLLDLNALTFTITVLESGYSYVLDSLPSGQKWNLHINLHGGNDSVTFI